MTRLNISIGSALLMVTFFAGCITDDPETGTQPDYWEGVAYDAENPNAPVDLGAADGFGYETPTDLPTLVEPEVIVSLEGLTVHLLDRATGFSEVYPVGVGVLDSQGHSITPTGQFTTSPDTSDGWWYIARRTYPEYFGGFPFVRLTAQNSRGQNTYGLHGPITSELIRGYVSHGCMRMAGDDIVRLFHLIRDHASTPVTIQTEVEIDAQGNPVDVGVEAALWAEGEEPDFIDDDEELETDGCADDRLEADGDVAIDVDTYHGLVLCTDDVDRYVLSLEQGDRVEVRLHFVHEIADLDMRAYGPDGESVGLSAGTSDDEVVVIDAETTGDYLIEVYMYGDGGNNGYSLTLSSID